jgi:amino acid transporter
VLFAYGGWNETAAVTAEVRDAQRNMLRGLMLGTGIVVLTYVLFNVALLKGLGFLAVAKDEAVAATLLSQAVGSWGAGAISPLVCISCLGAINGMLFTGARLYYALGVEHRPFAWLGHWNHRLGTPVRAVALQTLVAMLLLIVLGQNKDAAFQLLVVFTAPVFWSFMLLVSVAVVVLRFTARDVHRPFRLPLFPLEPLVFFASSALVIYSGVNYLFQRSQVGGQTFSFMLGAMLVVLVAGAAAFALARHGQR